ncbi:MAG: DUF3168 domain-containing protein [Sneathiella sp.]
MAATLEEALRSLIKGVAPTYPIVAPQKQQPPFLIYQRISDSGFDDLQGASQLETAIIQIDAYAQSYADAKGLAKSVKAILSGYSGVVDTVRIGACRKRTSRDLHTITDTKTEYRISTDYQFIFEE